VRGFTIGLLVKLLLSFTAAHALALLAPGLVLRWLIVAFFNRGIGWFVLGLVLLLLDGVLLLAAGILCTGLASRVLDLRPTGEHELDLRNPELQKWLVGFALYLPTATVLDLLHLYPLKAWHVRLFGGRVGRNSILGGMVTDPSLLQVGSETVIGGFSLIMCHATERGRIRFAPVRIGDRCGVGARALVLAGAVLEDGAVLGAHSLLPKGALIPAGETWGGVPARPIGKKED
jgi:hypothetical protein